LLASRSHAGLVRRSRPGWLGLLTPGHTTRRSARGIADVRVDGWPGTAPEAGERSGSTGWDPGVSTRRKPRNRLGLRRGLGVRPTPHLVPDGAATQGDSRLG